MRKTIFAALMLLPLMASAQSITRLPKASGGTVDVQSFTGDGTWTKPSSCSIVTVICYGGGGGGGAGDGGNNAARIGNLDLRAAQPYVEQFVALGIVSGALTTAGKVRFQTNDTTAPLLTFAGGVCLTNLVTTDQAVFNEFVRWDDLTVSGIEAALAPNRFKIDDIHLGRPKASLLIGADRRPNLSLILKKDFSATNNVAAPVPTAGSATNSLADQFPVQLGTLTLEQASLAFTDESVQPSVLIGIEQVSGTIKCLSSDRNSPADVDLHGRVDEQSTFSISGRVNPFPAMMFVDIAITNANTQLTPLTFFIIAALSIRMRCRLSCKPSGPPPPPTYFAWPV